MANRPVVPPEFFNYLRQLASQSEVDQTWFQFDNLRKTFEQRFIPIVTQHLYQEMWGVLREFRDINLSTLKGKSTTVLAAEDELTFLIRKIQDKGKGKFMGKVDGVMRATGNAFTNSTMIKMQLGGVIPTPRKVLDYITDRKLPLADTINDTSLRRIRSVVMSGVREGRSVVEIEAMIRSNYNGFIRSRPDLIARTETGVVAQMTERSTIESMGISEEVWKIWTTARDLNVRDSHKIEGQERHFDKKFSNGLLHPLQVGAPAKEIIQCRCALKHEKRKGKKQIDAPVSRDVTDYTRQKRMLFDTITEVKDIRRFGADVGMLLRFKSGKRAIFKPLSGEGEGLREGIKAGTHGFREAAASDIAEIVGMEEFVPATVVRKSKYVYRGEKLGEGSVQQWVDKLDDFKPNEFWHTFDLDDMMQLEKSQAFDFIMGQTDRHIGNWLMKDGQIKLIDNGLSLGKILPQAEGGELGAYKWFNEMWGVKAKQKYPSPPPGAKIKISDSVKDIWRGKWDEIESVLKKNGIDKKAIKLVKDRHKQFLNGNDWVASSEGRGWPPDPDMYWGDPQ